VGCAEEDGNRSILWEQNRDYGNGTIFVFETVGRTLHAEVLLSELRTEVSPGHPLHGVSLRAIARSTQADDVLFQFEDGRVCVVHLTSSGFAERNRCPSHRMFPTFEDWVRKVMIPDHEDYVG
jgi:hypothetical protein